MVSGTTADTAAPRRLRLGMVGGGEDAFIGAVHRIAARLDDDYELVAGCFASTAEKSRRSGTALRVPTDRVYDDFAAMAKAEAARADGIDVVTIVTPNHLHVAVATAFLDAGIDVICDKPLATSVADAEGLAAKVRASGRIFALTHNYTGYPLVREARSLVAQGRLGRIRVVQAEYAQDWLSTKLEDTGLKQAEWRTDPSRSGPVGCLGDIGTHAFNLATFVTGLGVERVLAELTTFVDGRRLDDDAQLLLRFTNGAKGSLWASQVAPGNENGLRLRVYGDQAGLSWSQEQPNELTLTRLGAPPEKLTRAGPGLGGDATRAARIPAGHPEGYLEGFANLYRDVAVQLRAARAGTVPPPQACLVPTVDDGVVGMRFVAAAVDSARTSRWVEL
ncbi:MAG: Gfo/Idh/MocA family oxidoreductase [Pseudomonadota bacterium]